VCYTTWHVALERPCTWDAADCPTTLVDGAHPQPRGPYASYVPQELRAVIWDMCGVPNGYLLPYRESTMVQCLL
jgi:hypothetical protein